MLVFPSRIILRSGRRLANILFGQQEDKAESEEEGDALIHQQQAERDGNAMDENMAVDDQVLASSPGVRRSTRSLRRSSRNREGKQSVSVVSAFASTSTSTSTSTAAASSSSARRPKTRSRRGVRVGSWKRTSNRTKTAKKKISKATTTKAATAVATVSTTKKKRKKRTAKRDISAGVGGKKSLIVQEALIIELLPDDLLDGPVLDALGFKDLCSLSLVCRRFEDAVNGGSRRWTSLYKERWGQLGQITVEASKLAGGWKKLYKAKHLAEKESAPWIQPCEHEVQAMLNHLAAFSNQSQSPPQKKQSNTPATSGAAASASASAKNPDVKMTVTFLVDGSGSVTEDDFSTMTSFMMKAVQTVNEYTSEKSMFGVLQFSNEVKEELGLTHITTHDFSVLAKQMSRMNGGTNIALALSKACRMVKTSVAVASPTLASPTSSMEIDPFSLPESNERTQIADPQGEASAVGAQEVVTPHLVILLTDGRVDSYQAREAVSRAEQFASEILGVTFFAFAVGRSVDKQELQKIVKTTCRLDPKAYETRKDFHSARDEIADNRVMGLRTLDEPPW